MTGRVSTGLLGSTAASNSRKKKNGSIGIQKEVFFIAFLGIEGVDWAGNSAIGDLFGL